MSTDKQQHFSSQSKPSFRRSGQKSGNNRRPPQHNNRQQGNRPTSRHSTDVGNEDKYNVHPDRYLELSRFEQLSCNARANGNYELWGRYNNALETIRKFMYSENWDKVIPNLTKNYPSWGDSPTELNTHV